jgi:hypothetical protein
VAVAAERARGAGAGVVFSAAAGMVGLSLSLIGLVRVLSTLRRAQTLAEEALAIDAFAFLAACLTAYAALRGGDTARARRLERAADLVFLAALVGMAAIGGFIAWEVL